ncbi:MAG: hypothetical protein HY730_02995 [Candidatus Tectomicrobia bacterium]|uniref:C4-type zinc ribbon domain-containing protein n=1 Tax=Tectimicrobiota bacterium TaxID=2528274 RepID=A0A933GML3_UNCTE|nr:hypothetical protein [Candidatus Tectomicrobia bacterium]
MSLAKELFQLQQIEQEIEAKNSEIARIKETSEKNQKVADAQSALDQAKEWLDKIHKDQKDKEYLLEDLQARKKDLEKKLYEGKEKGHKELESLRKEVEKLKAQVQKEEELLFGIMGEGDEANRNLARYVERLKQTQDDWNTEKTGFSGQITVLEQSLQELQGKRSQQVSRIAPQDLEIYNKLKSQKQGKAIARVEQGRCQGCRLNLSMNLLKRLRTENTPVFCDNCGRILLLE